MSLSSNVALDKDLPSLRETKRDTVFSSWQSTAVHHNIHDSIRKLQTFVEIKFSNERTFPKKAPDA